MSKDKVKKGAYLDNDMRHKKKVDSKSKSNRRSNHKHLYEKVILSYLPRNTNIWYNRCSICGRLDFLAQETFKGNINKLSIKELRAAYPETRIFVRRQDENGKLVFPDDDMIEEVLSDTLHK